MKTPNLSTINDPLLILLSMLRLPARLETRILSPHIFTPLISLMKYFRDKVWRESSSIHLLPSMWVSVQKHYSPFFSVPYSHTERKYFSDWNIFYTNTNLESQDPDTMNSLFISMLQTWSSCPQSVLTFASDPLSNTSIVLLRSPTTTCSWSQTMQLTPSVQRRILIPGPSTTQHQKSFWMKTPVLSQLMRTPLSQWRLWTGPLWPVRDLIPMIIL